VNKEGCKTYAPTSSGNLLKQRFERNAVLIRKGGERDAHSQQLYRRERLGTG
jgi:hypothetical protein